MSSGASVGIFFQHKTPSYVPVSALNKDEVKSHKCLAFGGLTFNTIILMILLSFTSYGIGYTSTIGFF